MNAILVNQNTEIVEASFNFWYGTNEHIRSPFPLYIQSELKEVATIKFSDWINRISEKAKDEVNDDILVEKLEEIIFETAIDLVKTEDEKITIRYPFLPRLGDQIKHVSEGNSNIIDREIIKKGDESFLKVRLLSVESKKNWETEFELPE